MARFIYGGPERYAHQRMALKKLISVGGVGALLMEPGTGKTAVTLDFMGVLALKTPKVDGVQEVRVLVIAPLAAVDTWVQQAKMWMTPEVNYWAEAVGGSIYQRAEALAARGGQPFPFWDPQKPPRGLSIAETSWEEDGSTVDGFLLTCKKCQVSVQVPGTRPKVADRALRKHLTEHHKDFRIRLPLKQRRIGTVVMDTPPRAEGWSRSWDWSGRASEGRTLRRSDGPDGLGKDKPRVIIEVINIDTLGRRDAVSSTKTLADVVLDGVRRYNPHLVVIDESHRVKGHTSNVSRLADRIGQIVSRRIILTGTVMPAGPLDVFSQWRFLDPYAFGDLDDDGVRRRATFQRFQSRFAVMGGYLGHQVVGYRNMDDLQTIMGQRAAVVLKKDALDLPPVIETVVPVMLSPAEKKAYMQMKKNLSVMFAGAATGPTATVSNRLVQIMRLRQITSGHLPDDQGIVREVGTSKADTIASLVHDTLIDEKRIVVFTLFTHELHMLKQKIERKGTRVETISGATHNDERMAIRRRFGNLQDHPERVVLIAQIKTLSLAVNELVTSQNIIFGSLSQQRDDLIQAIDRLNRIGQTGDKVNVWFVEAPGTVDGVIHQSHRDGTDLEQAVLDHVMQYNPGFDDDE